MGIGPQSNELTRGPNELIQYFQLKGKSQRLKKSDAFLHKIDISFAYPSGEEGGILLVLIVSSCLSRRGGGVSTLCIG